MPTTTTRDLEIALSGTSQLSFSWLEQHGAVLLQEGVALADDAHPLAGRVKAAAALLAALASDLGTFAAIHFPDDHPDCLPTRTTRVGDFAALTGGEPESRVLSAWRSLPPWQPAPEWRGVPGRADD